ncbi:MAG: hypothetical protein IJ391_03235 [Clostridia bacterium]|nr:hypothetical protein [Clostridia bacterium]
MNNILKISEFDGFVHCKSMFGEYLSLCNDIQYNFNTGVNILHGDIDDYPWAISYTLSNYKQCCDDFILSGNEKVVYNETELTLMDLNKFSCYIDRKINNKQKGTVREHIKQGKLISESIHSFDDIKDLFALSEDRLDRTIDQVGNEFIRSLIAIEYVNGKDIFCFPWLSSKKYEYYRANIDYVSHILTQLGKIIIIPTNNSPNNCYQIRRLSKIVR